MHIACSGLSTLPRLASFVEPAAAVGWTLTAPQPVSASASATSANAEP